MVYLLVIIRTILSMIGRIYDPDGGKISLDGFDIKTLNTTSLHTHIGIVNQVYFYSFF